MPETDWEQPHPTDLVHDLREALGWEVVALPYPPKQVWEEALVEVRRLVRLAAVLTDYHVMGRGFHADTPYFIAEKTDEATT